MYVILYMSHRGISHWFDADGADVCQFLSKRIQDKTAPGLKQIYNQTEMSKHATLISYCCWDYTEIMNKMKRCPLGGSSSPHRWLNWNKLYFLWQQLNISIILPFSIIHHIYWIFKDVSYKVCILFMFYWYFNRQCSTALNLSPLLCIFHDDKQDTAVVGGVYLQESNVSPDCSC